MPVCKDKKDYTIEEKRISKMIGMDSVPIEEIHHVYSIASKGKQSAIVIGHVVGPKENITLYITGNSSVKREQTFPIDDKMEIDMLDYVMRKINNKHHDTIIVQLSMKTCGVANLNISKDYWKTKRIDKSLFQQPLFQQIHDVLGKYGYAVYGVSKNDFYPIDAHKIGGYQMLPDTCSQNSVGIDGVIILKCKKVKQKDTTRFPMPIVST